VKFLLEVQVFVMTDSTDTSRQNSFVKQKLNQINLKIIVIGDPNAGKTSLIKRYCFEKFSLDYKATVKNFKKLKQKDWN
jgi:GTPase SAR1 family protein